MGTMLLPRGIPAVSEEPGQASFELNLCDPAATHPYCLDFRADLQFVRTDFHVRRQKRRRIAAHTALRAEPPTGPSHRDHFRKTHLSPSSECVIPYWWRTSVQQRTKDNTNSRFDVS